MTTTASPLRTPSTPEASATGDEMAPVRRAGAPTRLRLAEDWPLFSALALFPMWWMLGLAGFAFQLSALAMVGQWVVTRPRLVVPWPFPLLFGFLVLLFASMLQLDDFGRILGAIWRSTTYLGVAVWFLWIYNHDGPDLVRRVVRWTALFWVGCAVLGFVALALPELTFASPMEIVVPGNLLANELVFDLVHPRLSQVQDFIGFPLPRPAAPFPYSNSWGSAITILAPLYVLALSWAGDRWRRPGLLLAVAAIVPLIISANRTAWATLVVGLGFVAVRLARRGRTQLLMVLVVGFAAMTALVLATPLADLIVERFANPHSDEGRFSTYTQVLEELAKSPLLGYGAPRPNANPFLPALGTQGSYWLVLFSHGIPAMLLFVGFYGTCLLRALRVRSEFGVWGSTALLIAAVQSFFYDLIPAQLFIVTAISALLVRQADVEAEALRRQQHALHGRIARPGGATR